MKKLFSVASVILMASMIMTACAAPATEAPAPAAPTQAPAPTAVPPTVAPKFKVGEVTDTGGVDDKSFNASGWKGVQDAIAQLGVDGSYLESKQQADYNKNLQQYLSEKADLIITVGFLLGVDTATAAKANPNTNFAIVDYTFPDCWPGAVEGKDCGSASDLPNVRGLAFQTDQAAFMAGYAAAAYTKTGTVATFGGMKLPTVTIFMKGFEAGVNYYNQQKGKAVKVLGWDSAKDDGVFTNDFSDQVKGKDTAQSLVQEGADVVMPVAGPVGLGSAAYCKESGKCVIIGVDTDWFVSAPEYQDIELTSVMKKIDVAVFKTIEDAVGGKFAGGTMMYTLADGGVDLAPFHNYDGQVSAETKSELDAIRAGIIDGSIKVADYQTK